MAQSLVNFVHANGFPAGSYKTFFSCFPEQYKFIANSHYGHNSQFKWHKNWQHIIDELIHFIEQHNEPVVSIGHSFGGIVTFIAACQRPELFKGIILLDPPVITGSRAWLLKFAKRTRYIDKITPAGKAIIRRQYWPLGSDLASKFAKRKLFKNFDKRCLQDYANSAVIEKNQQLELLFSPRVEADIFRNIPTNLSSYKNKLTVPAALIYGEKTDVCPHQYFINFAKLNNIETKMLAGAGHMFPLEQPEKTAQTISEIIAAWKTN